MRIGDAAAAAGTTPRALRFYEQRGLLSPPPRSPSGQREYGRADVVRIRAIRELLALGLTVEDVAARAHRLDLLDTDAPQRCVGEPPGPETFAPVVARRLAALDTEIARLTRLRERLARHAISGRAAGPAPDEEG